MKKLLLTIALFAGITTATYAQGKVNVLYLDGTPHVIAMTDIDKIELTKGSINIVKVGGASESIDINKIDKIELKANATGITPITGKADGKIIVKANGYGFDVSGLANGADVMVYSQNGMLIGKAKAKDGSAHVDAASYPNGVYVIKAGGRSLKMVKK